MRVGTKNAMAVIGVASCLMAGVAGQARAEERFNWSGFFLGGDIGDRIGHAKWTTDSVTFFGNVPPVAPNTASMDAAGFHIDGGADQADMKNLLERCEAFHAGQFQNDGGEAGDGGNHGQEEHHRSAIVLQTRPPAHVLH